MVSYSRQSPFIFYVEMGVGMLTFIVVLHDEFFDNQIKILNHAPELIHNVFFVVLTPK